MWVCYQKTETLPGGTQGRPELPRDCVDGFSIAPDIFLDSGTPAAPPRVVPGVSRAPPAPLE